MSWYYNGQPIDEPPVGSVGFVYKITYTGNVNYTGGKRYYFGYKLFTHKTSRLAPAKKQLTVKGIPRKKPLKIKGTRPSGWQTYFGSCKPLNDYRQVLGDALFRREILFFGFSRKELLYREAQVLFCQGALEASDCWNENILGRWHSDWFRKEQEKQLTLYGS